MHSLLVKNAMCLNEYLRYLSSHPELVRYLFGQHIHIPGYFIVGDFRINLGSRDMLVAEHLADRLQRYALR